MSNPVLKTLFSALVACSLTLAGKADTVLLKSGERIEGKVLSESDAEITVEIVSGGVVDERKLSKADVQSVSKLTPDEVAWQSLKNLKLGDDSFPTAEQYDPYLSPLKAFITQFPASAHKAEAEAIAKDFEGEKKRVSDGELKLKGQWLSKEQVQRERYQVSATIAANYMAAQAGRNDLVGAMNTFEIIEQQFPGSRGYVEATGTALRVTAALKQAAAQRLAALPKENADREHGVKAAAGLDQIQLRKELELEKKNNATALAEAKARGQKWPPFLRRSEDGLKAIAKLADETEKRLVAFDRAKAVQSLDLAEQARADLDNNEIAAAEAKVKEATSLWSKNEIATRVAKNIEEARAAAKEAPAPAATPEPAPAAKATPKPTAKPRATPVGTASSESAPAASSSGTQSASVDEEKPPTNWLFIAVAGTLLAVLAFVAWRAYTRVRKKANEIIA